MNWKVASISLVFLGAALMAAGSIDFGLENTLTPGGDSLFTDVFNDARAYVYFPVGGIQGSVAVSHTIRADWSRWLAEAGAVWEWGGPLYSEARYGISLDSDSVVSHHGYADLFYEKAVYYLTGSLRGAADTSRENWSLLGSVGGTAYPWQSNTINVRVYAGIEQEQGDSRRTFSLAMWDTLQLQEWLALQAGGSVSLQPDAQQQVQGEISLGPRFRLPGGFGIGYQLQYDIPAGQRAFAHRLAVTGSLPVGE